jgi:uncharacterized protein
VESNFNIPYRTLGHTGEKVSCIGMGGFHLGKPTLSEKEAIELIHAGLDRGINFLDNSWDYNEGESERRMGKALQPDGYRQRAFLMTKVDGRTKDSAAKQIDESLKRLQTDHVDLLQFHEVIRFEDPDRIFTKGGAVEAFLEAKKRQDALHRFYRSQRSAHPFIHSRSGRSAWVPVRCRSVARQRHGRALPQLRKPGCSGAGER